MEITKHLKLSNNKISYEHSLENKAQIKMSYRFDSKSYKVEHKVIQRKWKEGDRSRYSWYRGEKIVGINWVCLFLCVPQA